MLQLGEDVLRLDEGLLLRPALAGSTGAFETSVVLVMNVTVPDARLEKIVEERVS